MAIEIIQGDCLDLMAKMADGSADCCITDPPYNVGFSYSTYDDNLPPAEYKAWCSKWFAELRRVVTGPIAISCGQTNVAMWCSIMPPTWIMSWYKPAAMGHSPCGICNWEPLLLWGKPPHRKCTDVIKAPIKLQHDASFHPCPKPIAWATGAMKALSKEGQTVLDPFCGSGTTAIGAYLTERNFIGCELDEAYCKLARQRLKNVMSKDVQFS